MYCIKNDKFPFFFYRILDGSHVLGWWWQKIINESVHKNSSVEFFYWVSHSLKINWYQLVASIGNHPRSLGINVRGFRGLLLLTNLRHDESLTKQLIILHCTAANEFTFSRTSKLLTIQEHRPPRITLMPQYLFQDHVILLDSLNTHEAERYPTLEDLLFNKISFCQLLSSLSNNFKTA